MVWVGKPWTSTLSPILKHFTYIPSLF